MSVFSRYKSSILQYAQYCLIGLSCASIDLGIINLLLFVFPTQNNIPLAVYNTIAYSLATLNSYIWNSKFTFRHHAKHSKKQIIGFVIQALVSLGISDLIFVGGTKLLHGMNLTPDWLVHNVAKLTSMFLSSLASFFFNKYLVFRTKKTDSVEKNSA